LHAGLILGGPFHARLHGGFGRSRPEFLEVRAKILELAASFDRLDRASGSVAPDPRVGQIREAIEVLLDQAPDRAERVQLVFSLPYDDDWRRTFDLASAK